MEIVIYLFLLFLSVIGLCEVFHYVKLAFLDTKRNKNKIVCCILKDDLADLQLRFIIEQYNWLGRKYADKIIAVNCLKDEDIINRCRSISDKYNVEFVSISGLHNLISSEL